MTCDCIVLCVSFTSHFHFCLYSTRTDVTVVTEIYICPTVCFSTSEHPPHNVH